MSNIAICPTVTAFGSHDYRAQMELLEPFAERIHIDLMDGVFAPHVSPKLDQIWWPDNITIDLHLMYQVPDEYIEQIIKLKPSLVIIHFEADGDHIEFADELHHHDIKAGLALLQTTTVKEAEKAIPHFDDVMVYSGHLGEHGGVADLSLLDKAREIKQKYPHVEISWDGGANMDNAKQLIDAGVSALNVGGYIHNAVNPQQAYVKLKELIGD